MEKLIYVFGVQKFSDHIQEAVSNGVLSAITMEVDKSDFSPETLDQNLKNVEWISKWILLHQEMLDKHAESGSILPFKFGAVFETRESILEMLDERQEQFFQILNHLEGKEEWALKLYYNPVQLEKWVLENNEEVKLVQQEMAISHGDGLLLLQKKMQAAVKQAIIVAVDYYRRKVYDKVIEISAQYQMLDDLKTEETSRDENALNMVCLIYADTSGQFKEEISKLESTMPENCLAISLTGPWPPYNFVS